MYYILLITSLISVYSTSTFASLREDLSDVRREDVLQTSIYLGKTLVPSQITGAILINDDELGTGVALDPYSVLTAANFKTLTTAHNIKFRLASRLLGHLGVEEYERTVEEIIPHRTFKHRLPFIIPENMVDQLYTQAASGLTLEYFKQNGLTKLIPFTGVDLAILKLAKPLPETLNFPTLLSKNFSIDNTYGISIGFGPLKFNNQAQGPTQASRDLELITSRHVIKCKLFTGTLESDNVILYGKYCGLMINGNESFIPSAEMLPTEGLPVGGDGGGPFFIKEDGTYKLAGILSSTLSLRQPIFEDNDLRVQLNEVVQPVFPIWQDIRPHLEWIQSHMRDILND